MNHDIYDMLDELERPEPGAPPPSEEFLRAVRKMRRKEAAKQFVFMLTVISMTISAAAWFYSAGQTQHASPPPPTPHVATDAPTPQPDLASRVTLMALRRANENAPFEQIELPALPALAAANGSPLFTPDDAARLR